jgi:hypothetical protein
MIIFTDEVSDLLSQTEEGRITLVEFGRVCQTRLTSTQAGWTVLATFAMTKTPEFIAV